MAGREERDHEFEAGLAVGVCLRYRFDTDRGQVGPFTVQLEVFDPDGRRWRPVVRYDDAHGVPHRDILDYDGSVVEKTPLRPGISNKQAMEEGARDIRAHFRTYIEAFWRTKR
jgi:hypothetical protein